MKLLFGGDSFAQFPSHWYLNTRQDDEIIVEYPSSPKGEGFTIEYDYKHWGELLAEYYDGTAVSVGLGAGDISSCTLICIQELLKNKYTHCIFSVTQYIRDIVQIDDQDPQLNLIKSSEDVIDFYNQSLGEHIDSHVSRIYEPLSKHRFIANNWWVDTDEIKGKHKNSISHYLHHVADFKYIHDRVSNLALLKTVCEQLNIKLLFSLPFDNWQSHISTSKFLQIDTFDYMDKVVSKEYKDSEQFKWILSHHTDQQHKEIFNLFLEQYSDWHNEIINTQ